MEHHHHNPESSQGNKFGLLLRHASQNSLDESNQNPTNNSPEEDDFRPLYKNVTHFEKAFGVLDSLRRSNTMCDITLLVDDIEVVAHRMVLAACSPYFYAMFTSFDEKDQDRVTIQGVDPLALQLLISYVYTGQISITEDNVQTLLPAANLLQLSDVKDACCNFLQTQLHPSNCLGIRAFSDVHSCLELMAATDFFIQSNFSEVVESEEFLALSAPQVAQLISSDKLTVPSEEKVFECVLNWVRHDQEVRQEFVPTLMEQVRLPLLPQDYLVNRVDEEPLLRINTKCKDLLIEALKFHLLRVDQKAAFTSPRTRPRQPCGLPKVLLVVGGQAPKAIRVVESYDFKEERWRLLADMPTRRCRSGLVVLHGRVYLVGGFNGGLRVRTCDIFNPHNGKWISGPSMNARRSTLGVAVLNDKIYSVGGFDGSTGLSSAEVFDPNINEWVNISPMSTRRSSVGVGVVSGKVFAIGGYDGSSRQCLNSVESYEPETDSWHTASSMNSKRSGAGVGVLDNLLYAVGGHDGPIVRKSVEVYDYLTDSWKNVAEMNCCRRNAGVVSINGMLVVIGGDDGTSNLSSVEVYCPKTNTWSYLNSSMVVGRSYAGCAVIDKPQGYQ